MDNNLIMNYDLTITSTNLLYDSDASGGYKFDLRLSEKGVQIIETMNSYSNSMSIHIPKTSPYRLISTLDGQNRTIFNDFNSVIKKGDKVELYLAYSDSPLVVERVEDYNYWQYIVNEVIIHEETVELKCLDMGYFLVNSFIQIKDVLVAKTKTKTKGKKEQAEILIEVKDIGELLVETANKAIKKANDKILKLKSKNKNLIINTYPYLKLELANGLNFKMRFTKGGRMSCMECLKILEKDYLMNTQIYRRTRTRGISSSNIPLSIPRANLYVDEYFLQIGVNWDGIKNGQNNDDFYRTYFSDIPQALITNVKNKGFSKDNKYYKIIERQDLNYQQSDNVSYRVKATIFDENSKKREFEAKNSDANGELRSFIIYDPTNNLKDDEISLRLDNFLSKLKYDGFRPQSTFTTFGFPKVNPNEIVVFDGVGNIRTDSSFNNQITNPYLFLPIQYYFVESVETTFDSNGWRQKIGITYNIPNMKDEDTLVDAIYSNNFTHLMRDDYVDNFSDIMERQTKTRENINNNYKKNDIDSLFYKEKVNTIDTEIQKLFEKDVLTTEESTKLKTLLKQYWKLTGKEDPL